MSAKEAHLNFNSVLKNTSFKVVHINGLLYTPLGVTENLYMIKVPELCVFPWFKKLLHEMCVLLEVTIGQMH